MNISVTGRSLSGAANIISSKSDLHRLLICAALSKTPTIINGVTISKDIAATIDCLRAFAAEIEIKNDVIVVRPYAAPKKSPVLDCNESGSTLRFLLPVIAALGIGGSFIGSDRLAERPLSPLYELLESNGCSLSPQGHFPLKISGKLSGNRFCISGDISSQFISGLLFSAPLLRTGCEIQITGKVESYPYIQMTLNAMQRFGVQISKEKPFTFKISKNDYYNSPGEIMAEGDWSNAAFWLVAAAISKSYNFVLSNLNRASLQGDMLIVSLLQKAGVKFKITGNALQIIDAANLSPLHIDAAQIPDLVPVLAVFASAISGETVIYNAQRLIYKESNRLLTVNNMVSALGGQIRMTDDGLVINGTGRLCGGEVNACNDHRIAMAAAVASFICESPVTILDAQAVEKSYPNFYKEFASKGMIICPPFSEQN